MSTPRAGTRARQAVLLRLLHEDVTSVDALAERLGVSTSTVRRDLERLRDAGTIARTYGGAIVPERFHERSYAESSERGRAAKQAIARAAAGLVPPSGQVFVDAGTTCAALAELIAAGPEQAPAPGEDEPGRDAGPGEPALTVVTRGLETALALAGCEHVAVEVIGGRVRPLSHGLVGPLGFLAVSRMRFDVAFLGADVVSPERGVGEPSQEETAVKEQVAARAARTVVLADAAKLTAPPAPAWTGFAGPWTLVTDADEETVPGLAARCAANGVELLRPGAP